MARQGNDILELDPDVTRTSVRYPNRSGERARLDKVSAPPMLYPFWQHINSAVDRLGVADILPLEHTK